MLNTEIRYGAESEAKPYSISQEQYELGRSPALPCRMVFVNIVHRSASTLDLVLPSDEPHDTFRTIERTDENCDAPLKTPSARFR